MTRGECLFWRDPEGPQTTRRGREEWVPSSMACGQKGQRHSGWVTPFFGKRGTGLKVVKKPSRVMMQRTQGSLKLVRGGIHPAGSGTTVSLSSRAHVLAVRQPGRLRLNYFLKKIYIKSFDPSACTAFRPRTQEGAGSSVQCCVRSQCARRMHFYISCTARE